jgi:hypothetical protein
LSGNLKKKCFLKIPKNKRATDHRRREEESDSCLKEKQQKEGGGKGREGEKLNYFLHVYVARKQK